MTEPGTSRRHQRHPRETATDEFSKLVIIVGYLWVIFELLSIHKSIVLSEYHLNYPEHAFAIVNFLVFAKVLLTQNRLWNIALKLWRCVCSEQHPGPRETSPWAIDSRNRSLGMRVSSSGRP
jgi:hypothetical protein